MNPYINLVGRDLNPSIPELWIFPHLPFIYFFFCAYVIMDAKNTEMETSFVWCFSFSTNKQVFYFENIRKLFLFIFILKNKFWKTENKNDYQT